MEVRFPVNFFLLNPNIQSEINVLTYELFYICLTYIKRCYFLHEKRSMFLLENTETNCPELPFFPHLFWFSLIMQFDCKSQKACYSEQMCFMVNLLFYGGGAGWGSPVVVLKALACLTALMFLRTEIWEKNDFWAWVALNVRSNDMKNEPVIQPYFNFLQCLIGGNGVFYLDILFKNLLRYQFTVSFLRCVQ